MRMPAGLRALGLSLALGLGLAGAAAAQDGSDSQPLRPVASPILTLDSERLLRESAAGRAIEAELAEKSNALAAENRSIEADLTAEEKDLTERRPTLSPADFRAAATAFDEKVQAIRNEQDAKLRALQEQSNNARVEILRAADPVLTGIMQEAGAAVIMELSNVLASVQAVDITQLAITRLDAAMTEDAAPGDAAPGDAAPGDAPGDTSGPTNGTVDTGQGDAPATAPDATPDAIPQGGDN